MAYDESLAARIRTVLAERNDIGEKKMFGGICFLMNGNMCCGVHKDSLIVRLSAEQAAVAVTRPHARVMDLTGRPMKGWLMVAPEGVARDGDLATWVGEAAAFVETLPAK
jgi:hypothetical protein